MARDESFGNVYLEAACSGLPIVAHDTAVTRWILGDCAGLVDTDDDQALRSALTVAIDRDRDSPVGDVAELAERFGWSTIARQYEQFLTEVIAAATDSP